VPGCSADVNRNRIEASGSDRARENCKSVETLMSQPQTRRLPWLAPLAPPRLNLGDLWWRHRDLLCARLGAALGMVLLPFVLIWAAGEYADYMAALRAAETSRYLAEFRTAPVGAAWRHLNAAWQAEQDRQGVLLARLAGGSGSAAGVALRHYRQFVLETVEDHRLPADIETVRRFFDRLAVCVRVGNCDREAAAAHLRPALRRFRDQHYYYFESEGTAAEFDRVVAQIMPDELWLRAAPTAVP
jgi:hypothetical protein